jgi:REP element-mobilizing transposase RayT
MKQLQFKNEDVQRSKSYGGALRNRAKGRTARPISTKKPMHFVLRTKDFRESLRLGKNRKVIESYLKIFSHKYGIHVEQFVINSNHIHFIWRIKSRALYPSFIKAFTGSVAKRLKSQVVQSLRIKDQGEVKERLEFRNEKLKTLRPTERNDGLSNVTMRSVSDSFWQYRPFSRVVEGYRGHNILKDYLWLNKLESLSILPYRKTRMMGFYKRVQPGFYSNSNARAHESG